MISFNIDKSEIKLFMTKLLKEDAFDKLELRTLSLETIIKYDISGNINKDYLKENEERFFVRWGEIKPSIVKLITGDRKPKYIKIVFSLDDQTVANLSPNASAMFLNIYYQDDTITCTTGTSQKSFSLDKSQDKVWEDVIIKFFKKNDINVYI